MKKKIITDPQPTDSPKSEGPPSRSLLQYTSLAAYFHERLSEVRQSQSFDATETSEFYVVNLLETFSQADQLYHTGEDGRRENEALAMILHRAVFCAPGEQVNHYRRLGDVALFIAGFFAQSLKRGAVGLSYYIDMGQGAYSSLADHVRGRDGKAFRELFQELADTFSGWVEVLRALSAEASLGAQLNSLPDVELFERWSRLKGAQADPLARTMLSRGLIPVF